MKTRFNIARYLSCGFPVVSIWSARGDGKTLACFYTFLKHCLKTRTDLLYVVQTTDHIKALLTDNASGMFDDLRKVMATEPLDKFDRVMLRLINKKLKTLPDQIKVGDITIYLQCINGFERAKGVARPNISRVIFDEYVPEVMNAIKQRRLRALLSIIQSTMRTREFKLVLLANTIRPNEPIISKLFKGKVKRFGVFKHCDDIGPLWMHIWFDNRKLLAFMNKKKASISGRLSEAFNETQTETNTGSSALWDLIKITDPKMGRIKYHISYKQRVYAVYIAKGVVAIKERDFSTFDFNYWTTFSLERDGIGKFNKDIYLFLKEMMGNGKCRFETIEAYENVLSAVKSKA